MAPPTNQSRLRPRPQYPIALQLAALNTGDTSRALCEQPFDPNAQHSLLSGKVCIRGYGRLTTVSELQTVRRRCRQVSTIGSLNNLRFAQPPELQNPEASRHRP